MYALAAEHGNNAGMFDPFWMFDHPLRPKKKTKEEKQAEELYKQGLRYELGDGVRKNFRKAFLCYNNAARQSHPLALYREGLCYMRGRGVKKNACSAAISFRVAADQKLPEAQDALGLCLLLGIGVQNISPERGAMLIRQAAEQGLAAAQYDLGLCYEFGRGVETGSVKIAIKHYKRAARKGFQLAKEKLDELKRGIYVKHPWRNKAAWRSEMARRKPFVL